MLCKQKYTEEKLVTEKCAFEVEVAIEKLKSYKSTGIDQIPEELNKAGCNKVLMVRVQCVLCFDFYRVYCQGATMPPTP